jgi:hypothetical protein
MESFEKVPISATYISSLTDANWAPKTNQSVPKPNSTPDSSPGLRQSISYGEAAARLEWKGSVRIREFQTKKLPRHKKNNRRSRLFVKENNCSDDAAAEDIKLDSGPVHFVWVSIEMIKMCTRGTSELQHL